MGTQLKNIGWVLPRIDARHGVGMGMVVFAAMLGTCSQRVADPGWLPHTNNAVTAIHSADGVTLVTALGLTSAKTWRAISNQAAAYTPATGHWRALAPVPGPGRLAATAQTVRGRVIVFGGYTVDSAGHERSLPNVDIYDPERNEWTRGAHMPTPVDDAVSAVYRDSLVYIVSGWRDTANVRDVQIYDAIRDEWLAATPFPGTPVFGHSGGMAGTTLIVVDGTQRNDTRPRYSIVKQAWRGDIDSLQPTRITWRRIPDHTGPALYRAASGACRSHVIVAGGTDNPYNYNGIGYNGTAAAPRDEVFAYDIAEDRWQTLGRAPTPSMDHRALVITSDGEGWTMGGMRSGQQVSGEVMRLTLPLCRLAPA